MNTRQMQVCGLHLALKPTAAPSTVHCSISVCVCVFADVVKCIVWQYREISAHQ